MIDLDGGREKAIGITRGGWGQRAGQDISLLVSSSFRMVPLFLAGLLGIGSGALNQRAEPSPHG